MRFSVKELDYFTDLAIHEADKYLKESVKEQQQEMACQQRPALYDKVIMNMFESLESREISLYNKDCVVMNGEDQNFKLIVEEAYNKA